MKDESIKLTQGGQFRPYADSVFAGTVTAETEADARAKLAKMREVDEIFDRQHPEKWSFPYFTRFAQVEPNKWEFRIVEEYTG